MRQDPPTSSSSDALVKAVTEEIASGRFEVPLLPQVAQKVIELLQSPDADAVRLSRLIQGDQSLAAHVMRVANSAAYSPTSSLVSLQQAIARLGINLIGEIALTTSLNGKLFNVPGYDEDLQQQWRHALATALWSKEISRQCRKNVEATFLCGLLHAIGWPVVLQIITDTAKARGITAERETVVKLAQQLHIKMSETVIKHWKMPELIAEAVAHINCYADAPQYSEQAATINAAAELARHTLTDDNEDDQALLEHPALAFLNLYRDEIEHLLSLEEKITSGLESMSQ